MQTLQQPRCDHVFIRAPDNGELVCRKCGLVKERGTIHTLPFDQTFAPTSAIVFGKSLGNTITSYGLLRVLARGVNGKSDLGIRARQIKILTQTTEPILLRKALSIASAKLIILGFEENHVVSNDVGALLRKVATFCLISKINCSAKELADAVIYYVLTKSGYEANPPPVIEKGLIKTNVLQFRQKFLRLCRLLDAQTRDF